MPTDSRPTGTADSDAESLWIEMLRDAPVWKRAEQLTRLIQSRNDLILADLRHRYPQADEKELRVRLAARLLPRRLVVEMFDWDPEIEGY